MIAVYAYYSLLVQSYSLQDSFVTDTTLMGKILLVTPMLDSYYQSLSFIRTVFHSFWELMIAELLS